MLASDWNSRKVNRIWQTPCNSAFVLFADGCICLQCRGTGGQYSICTEIWVICHVFMPQLPSFRTARLPAITKLFILAFQRKSDLTLWGVIGDGFWNYFFFNESAQLMLIFRSWIQIIALSLNPIESDCLSHNIKERYLKTQNSMCDHIYSLQPHQLTHTAF